MTVSSPHYLPEQIWQARHAFFDDGIAPEGLVDAPVLRSWRRCLDQGRRASEAVEFDAVERGALVRLLDDQRSLLAAARPALSALAGAVADAGYAVLLTDARGRALAVDGGLDRRSVPLRQAFRPGVDLSENMIGTNAMSSAIAEQRSVRVLGPEHFFADNQIFHCCAAPVFDPQGRVVGAVDVSRDMPGLAAGALALTQRCARRIERQLFDALPAFMRLNLETPDASDDAWLAFDRDAVLLAATPAALHLLDLPGVPAGASFGELFDDRFEAVLQAARRDAPQELHLRGGVRLRARAVCTGALTRSLAAPIRNDHRQPARPAFGDAAFDASFDRALRAFEADLPVLVTGETGVGKEVAARALHDASGRSEGPFVALNCGAIAPQLMAADLFGHVEGAYTGARRGGSAGRIEAAQGGSLLLDEIGDMPLELQVGLLRVLDSGEVVRVGATRAQRADVRFICATHRDLRALVAEGRFREDLYYRIAAFTLHLPPLRARSDFDAVLDALLAQQGCPPERVGSAVREVLKSRPWPGNVRQLRSMLRLAAALADDRQPFGLDHFPAEASEAAGAAPAPANPDPGEQDSHLGWQHTQQQAIAAALKRTGGNVTAAAALLGIGRATLYRKLPRKSA
ncbi:sigma-54-dependent Fis family transcriptional regulator [Aquabacterium sp.]|uniref:sigma-54-dependent Fis family transcriptional regulator n=1 Tax=Aquabacterium sp. TaxID=1872578 RepID=UPI002D802B97|nr:sigma-54-dependent Fis family transcriptional regulator [Aquabacterium sp.]